MFQKRRFCKIGLLGQGAGRHATAHCMGNSWLFALDPAPLPPPPGPGRGPGMRPAWAWARLGPGPAWARPGLALARLWLGFEDSWVIFLAGL